MRFLSYVIFAFIMTFYNTACAEVSNNTATLFQLFGSMCWSSMGNYSAIDGLLTPKKLLQLTQSQAMPFLADQKGKAWPILLPQGSYVLAVTESNVCSMFAKKANAAEVNAELATMIEKMVTKGGFKLAKKTQEQPKDSPKTTLTTSYLLQNKDEKSDLALAVTLTTSESSQAVAQALLSFSVVSAE